MAIEMKTLTCKDENGNDVTFTVSDPDAINCCEQQLTDEQKAQARANIGAVCHSDMGEALKGYAASDHTHEQYLTAIPSEYVTEGELATVAKSGSYSDLSNKPTIPTVPTNVSAFTNDAGYLAELPSHSHDYLPLSGGEISGALTCGSFTSKNGLFRSSNNVFRFGTSTTDGHIAVLARNSNTNYFRAGSDDAMDLGIDGTRWRNLYLAGNISDGTNSVKVADIPTNKETWTFTLEDGSTVTKAVYIG